MFNAIGIALKAYFEDKEKPKKPSLAALIDKIKAITAKSNS